MAGDEAREAPGSRELEGKDPERWHLERDGRLHVVSIGSASAFSRIIRWTVDGEEAARKKTSDERVTLAGKGHDLAVTMKISGWSDSARRVRLFSAGSAEAARAAAIAGLGGTDFLPAAGTKAARRQERMEQHPWRYTLTRTIGALAGVGLPILVIWLLGQLIGQIAFPDVDLPEVPLPDVDLPRILPRIDLPDVDLPDLPAWMDPIRDAAKYVVPVLIAFAVARVEVRRRRRLAQERRRDAATTIDGDAAADRDAAADQEAAADGDAATDGEGGPPPEPDQSDGQENRGSRP